MVAEKSGQKVDWHYSGGVAQVLYIGDRSKIIEAINSTPCFARILKYFDNGQGLHRLGEAVLEGTIGGFYQPGGSGTTFIK